MKKVKPSCVCVCGGGEIERVREREPDIPDTKCQIPNLLLH